MRLSSITAIGALCAVSAISLAQVTTPEEERDTTTSHESSATQSEAQGQMGTTPSSEERTRTASATRPSGSKMTTDEFVKKAGAGGMMEVEAGKIAEQKATNPEVKAFAQRMVTDHSKANKELMAAAQSKNIEMPSQPEASQKMEVEKLRSEKAGKGFDHAYMKHMVSDHEKDVKMFQEATTAQNVDPEFRSWAKKTLPTLEDHLKEAKQLEHTLAQSK